jgi:hypothetical protein
MWDILLVVCEHRFVGYPPKSFVTFLSSRSEQLLVLNWWKIFIFQREKENNIGYIDVDLKRVGKRREEPRK